MTYAVYSVCVNCQEIFLKLFKFLNLFVEHEWYWNRRCSKPNR